MFDFFSSPSKEEKPLATTTISASATEVPQYTEPHLPPPHPRQHRSSIVSQVSMSSASNSPISSGVMTSSQHRLHESTDTSSSFLQSVLSSPTPFVSSHPGSAPTVAPEPTPRRISFRSPHEIRAPPSPDTTAASSYFEDVQQGFLDPNHGQRPSTPKTLFSSAACSNNMNSDSSNEDFPRMMSMMRNATTTASASSNHRHKARRKSRSSKRTCTNSRNSNSSSLSHSLLLDGYDEGSGSRKNQPLAVRRRSSQRDFRRISSSELVAVPPPAALVSPTSSDCFSDRRCSSQTRRQSQNEYMSPEMSSESSPDSSPNRLHLQKQQSQHQLHRKQGSISSMSRLSGSSSDPSNHHNNDSSHATASLIGSSGGGGNGGLFASFKSLLFGSQHKKWGTRSWCLALTFVGMVAISLSGTVVLTSQASFFDEMSHQEQSINRPDVFPSSAGLRGKMVQGKWDVKPLSSGSSSKKPVKKVAPAAAASESRKNKEKSMDAEKTSPKQEKSSTATATSKPAKKTSSDATKKPAPKVPSRLKMHMPPKISLPEVRFDTTDSNMYGGMMKSRPEGDDSKQALEKHPRIFMLDPAVAMVDHKLKTYPSDFTDNTQLYGILPSDDERLSHMEIREPYSDGECVPMQDWQTAFHPYCNGMHELALEALGSDLRQEQAKDPYEKLLGGTDAQIFGIHGFWRYAWKLTMGHWTNKELEQDTIVLKTLKYEHNFEDAHFEHDRVDAVAMERLTSSPHVINIFGFCGHSVLTEYADGTRVGALADKARKKPLDRLRIARDIANGLADVHGIDGDGNATFVHLDVNPANVVSIGGTLKLNDFNIGIIRRWNTTSNEPCGFPAQYPNPQWRSPEEARNEQDLTEKVDIFSMGHIFFRLICGHEPWNKLEPGGKPSKEEINEKVKQGKLPFIPDHVKKSENPEVIAIRDVMLSCYQPNPKDRPNARDIAKKLDATLKELSENPPPADETEQ